MTAANDSILRVEARRWLDAAPAAGQVWSFSDLLPPKPEEAIELEGHTYRVDECLVAMRTGTSLIHASVYHPSFVLTSAPVKKAAYLLLDALLGERAMESWIGGVDAVPDPDPGSVPLHLLRAEVDSRACRVVSQEGRPKWYRRESEQDGAPPEVKVAPPLDPIVAPLSTEHVVATVEYSDRDAQGMPGPNARDRLSDLEELVSGRLTEHEWLVAVETGSGRRRFHFYRDPTVATRTPLDRWLAKWTDGPTSLHAENGPGWDQVQRFRF